LAWVTEIKKDSGSFKPAGRNSYGSWEFSPITMVTDADSFLRPMIYRVIVGFLIHKAGLTQGKAQCDAVTPFGLRFLFASNPAAMGEALGIVYRALAGFLIKKAGLTQSTAQCGAITVIQRFGSASLCRNNRRATRLRRLWP
jgi:hypothetical protein